MKRWWLAVAALLILGAVAGADDQVSEAAGRTVSVRIGKTVAMTSRKRPVFSNVIVGLSVKPGQTSSPSVIITGKVVDDNAGMRQEFVPIFFGSTLHLPRLAALTDADGAFRLRVRLIENPSEAALRLLQTASPRSMGLAAKDLSSASLYLDGAFDSSSEMRSSNTTLYSLSAFAGKDK